MGSDRDMSSNYNMHFSFEKSSQKFTVFHKRNITSSQVTTHLKNYLGEQNNRRTTEKENGWNPPFYRIPFPPKGCWGRMRNISGRWGRISPPSPLTDRYEQPLPPKGCWERMRNLSGRWGRIRPLPQETGTSTPFPNRPVRATPSPKRMLRAHAQHQWTLGAHQTPLPQETGTSNPFPLTPTSLYKGITDRAHS